MKYNTYGKTGVKVSAIGFGGMRFKDQSDTDGCAALLKYAYDKGVNLFDTAPGYGKSEEIYGQAFKEMRKTRETRPFYISTKSSDATPEGVRRDLETSLKRLNAEQIDFYHVWCVMSAKSYNRRKTGGALKEMEKIKAEGLARHICVSTHSTGAEIREMLKDYPFEGLLIGYSAMNFSYREEGLEEAAKQGMGIAIMNPLGGGLIPRHPERFSFVKTRADESVVEGALRFLLNDKRIATLFVGFSNTDEIDEAVRADAGFKPIAPETVKKIRDSLKTSFDRLCTGCGYCDECKKGVPIPKLMEAFNHRILGNQDRAALDRLRWHWGINADDEVLRLCDECGECEEKCTQKLPIREQLAALRRSTQIP